MTSTQGLLAVALAAFMLYAVFAARLAVRLGADLGRIVPMMIVGRDPGAHEPTWWEFTLTVLVVAPGQCLMAYAILAADRVDAAGTEIALAELAAAATLTVFLVLRWRLGRRSGSP